MNNHPIFIVGVQRSGTTLLAAMLAAHSRISCGPETHFFRKLSCQNPSDLVGPATWPGPAVDFLSSITHTNFSDQQVTQLLDKYQLDPSEITAHLSSQKPEIRNILSSITALYMQKMGKSRWAEKTPDHIAHLVSIRTYFPESPIIRIVRDPRDVALSLMKVPWGAKSFLEGLLYWKKLHEGSEDFFQQDSNCYSICFEQLVSNPQETIQALCNFIGEEYEESMLDTTSTGKQLNTRAVSWKTQASKPLDVSRIGAWRGALSPEKNILAEAFLGNHLNMLGYGTHTVFNRAAEIYPPGQIDHRYELLLQGIAAEGVRFWKESPLEKSTVTVFVGEPGPLWLGARKMQRVIRAFSVSTKITTAILSNRFLYWIAEQGPPSWRGYLVYFLEKLLSPYRFTPTG